MAAPKPRWGGGTTTKPRVSRRRVEPQAWKRTSTRKRGTAYGSAPTKTNKQGLSQANGRKQHSRVQHATLERNAEGYRHQHVLNGLRTHMYEQVISTDEAEVYRLKGIKDALTSKIILKDETMVEVGEMKSHMKDEMTSTEKIRSALVKQNNELGARRNRLQQELKAGQKIVEDQKARFKEVVSVSKDVIIEVEGELEAAESMFLRRMEDLNTRNQQLVGAIKEVEASVDLTELAARRKESQQQKEDVGELKQALMDCKALTLHRALVTTMVSSHDQSKRLHQIIAHLQAEQHKTNERSEIMTAEVNVLQEELETQENAQQMLCEEGYAGAKAFEAAAAEKGVEVGSPLTKMTRDHAAAACMIPESAERQEMNAKVAKLQAKLSAAQLHTERLHTHLQAERQRHSDVERDTREQLEKERTELLRSAQQLENANDGGGDPSD